MFDGETKTSIAKVMEMYNKGAIQGEMAELSDRHLTRNDLTSIMNARLLLDATGKDKRLIA